MLQSNRQLVTLTVQGSCFTFDRYWLPNSAPRPSKTALPEPVEDADGSSRGLILEKRVRRSKTRLIATFSRLHPLCQPRLFVCLTFPVRIRKRGKSRSFREIFKVFCRRLRYQYPYCWFLYKVEWSPKAGIHYHLIGSLLPRNRCNILPHHHKALLKLWEQALGASYAKGVSVGLYDKHISYLTTPNKRFEDMRCADILGKRRMWGYINKSNMMFTKRKVLKLTQSQFQHFSGLVDSYLSQHSTSISHRYQLYRPRGRVSFIPRSVIMHAYKQAIQQGEA